VILIDVGSAGARKSWTGFSKAHGLSATYMGRAKILLERKEFHFSICSETVNPFPELGLYR
jgi:hypothetical protein